MESTLTVTTGGVTYLAGCTDPTFSDEQCAQKPGYTGQQWVALARCSGENISLWTGCAHHPSQVELEKENCSCNLTNVLIENTNGQSTLGEIGSLPTSAGGTISFNPTALPSYAVTTTDGPSSVASGTATATAAEGASGGGSGLSGGAKAGIAVGSIIGGLLVLGALGFLFRRAYRRRVDQAVAARASRTDSAPPPPPPHEPSPMSQLSSQVSPAPPYNVSAQIGKSEEDGNIAGLGYKSEMPGESTYKPELPGDIGAVDSRRHELGT